MGITLKEIAEMAGVHKSTVDKVIHNRPGVSDAKRQEIRRLLREYNYESNPLAKALNYQKKKGTIAVVLPIVDALSELKEGMELVRQDFGSFNFEIEYHETPSSDAATQAQHLRELCQRGVSGIVLDPIENPVVCHALEELAAAKVPVITVNSDLEDSPRLSFVGQDMEQAGQTAARLMALLLGGSGTLGIISSQAMRALNQRRESFERYLSEEWPAIKIAEVLDIQEIPEKACQNTAALLKRHSSLDALYITCGCVPEICRAVREQKRSLSILCYEQYPAIVELVKTGDISCTISGGLRNQGRLAMRLLFEYIIYDRPPVASTIYTENKILFRENI